MATPVAGKKFKFTADPKLELDTKVVVMTVTEVHRDWVKGTHPTKGETTLYFSAYPKCEPA